MQGKKFSAADKYFRKKEIVYRKTISLLKEDLVKTRQENADLAKENEELVAMLNVMSFASGLSLSEAKKIKESGEKADKILEALRLPLVGLETLMH